MTEQDEEYEDRWSRINVLRDQIARFLARMDRIDQAWGPDWTIDTVGLPPEMATARRRWRWTNLAPDPEEGADDPWNTS